MKKVKRRAVLVELDDKLYIQKPTSWKGGWARSIILERLLGRKLTIASHDVWDEAVSKGEVLHFIQYEDGTYDVN